MIRGGLAKLVMQGLRFGMLLQLSIGPVCLLVFQTSLGRGFRRALLLILAVALVDAAYIGLAVAGVSALLRRNRVQKAVRLFGGIILIVFGLNLALGAFHFQLLPQISLFSVSNESNLFFQGILLTASNPLTIVFWSGVFSAKVARSDSGTKNLLLFGSGCVLATLFFLGAVAALGRTVGSFLPPTVLTALNVSVGAAIIAFGVRMTVSPVKDKS
ncbi:LysE family translocator [Caproicibacter sp.]|uniref:LysE family translocator n=1 Tax=Caproicibacter sp. TaxID=2814884 RepID=UPI003988A39A